MMPYMGHFSELIELENGLMLLSGLKAWNDEGTGIIDGGIEVQTRRICDLLDQILRRHGLDLQSLARVQVFLADIDDYETFDSTYREVLSPHKPARCVIGGCTLRAGARIELLCEAYRAD